MGSAAEPTVSPALAEQDAMVTTEYSQHYYNEIPRGDSSVLEPASMSKPTSG
jgi:hypothetical protein